MRRFCRLGGPSEAAGLRSSTPESIDGRLAHDSLPRGEEASSSSEFSTSTTRGRGAGWMRSSSASIGWSPASRGSSSLRPDWTMRRTVSSGPSWSLKVAVFGRGKRVSELEGETRRCSRGISVGGCRGNNELFDRRAWAELKGTTAEERLFCRLPAEDSCAVDAATVWANSESAEVGRMGGNRSSLGVLGRKRGPSERLVSGESVGGGTGSRRGAMEDADAFGLRR